MAPYPILELAIDDSVIYIRKQAAHGSVEDFELHGATGIASSRLGTTMPPLLDTNGTKHGGKMYCMKETQ